MEEKELDKIIDYLIIEGLIKESEQDNADFEAAMRRMSDSAFMGVLGNYTTASISGGFGNSPFKDSDPDAELPPPPSHLMELSSGLNSGFMSPAAQMSGAEEEEDYGDVEESCYAEMGPVEMKRHIVMAKEEDPEIADVMFGSCYAEEPEVPTTKSTGRNSFKPWIAAAVAAIAILLIVLIPNHNAMDAKLCESAVAMSEFYKMPSGSHMDIFTASEKEIKSSLPEMERRYRELSESFVQLTEYAYTKEFDMAAWNLTLAYLRLHRRDDAGDILRELTEGHGYYSPYIEQYRQILELLD